jgi:hypothetical protein
MGISPVERTIPCNLKVPESPERGNTRFFAPMHDFIVTLEVGGDEDNYVAVMISDEDGETNKELVYLQLSSSRMLP